MWLWYVHLLIPPAATYQYETAYLKWSPIFEMKICKTEKKNALTLVLIYKRNWTIKLIKLNKIIIICITSIIQLILSDYSSGVAVCIQRIDRLSRKCFAGESLHDGCDATTSVLFNTDKRQSHLRHQVSQALRRSDS